MAINVQYTLQMSCKRWPTWSSALIHLLDNITVGLFVLVYLHVFARQYRQDVFRPRVVYDNHEYRNLRHGW